MNKPLEKKIDKLEALKKKELDKIDAINVVISDYDKQLKVLYDYKKQQEKIYQMQQDLDTKILGDK
ncbi:MAG: hypothetical protein IJ565_05955 [Bacilli bacterium]|nr:hypothetical protein [Bacilli bacterium]